MTKPDRELPLAIMASDVAVRKKDQPIRKSSGPGSWAAQSVLSASCLAWPISESI